MKNSKSLIYTALACAFALFSFSCNKDDKDEEVTETIDWSASSVAITSFSLQSDDSVCYNLGSVFFTIDLVGREIFNADSLPAGTNVTKLRVDLTYPTTASEVKIRVKDGERLKDSEFDYIDSQTDSIDFTGKVTVKIVAENTRDSAIYTLKVNVHKLVPDSLYWDEMAVTKLPAIGTPVDQKTVSLNGVIYDLIKTSDGKYTLSTTTDPYAAEWEKKIVQLPFEPKLESLVSTYSALYMLSQQGKLYTSADGATWTATNAATVYSHLYGGYQDAVLGVSKDSEGNYMRHIYSQKDGDKELGYTPEKFPVSQNSPLVEFAAPMALSPQVLMVGGVDNDGSYSNVCWGFDGNEWAQVSATQMPELRGAVLVPYRIFKVNDDWTTKEYDIIMAFSGVDGYDRQNTKVYYSYDYGVYWKQGDENLDLPEYMPYTTGAQAIVVNTKYTRASVVNGWTAMPTRKLPVWAFPITRNQIITRGDYTISWECPYIYLFGGYDEDGALHDTVWRGVLNRLTFKPLI